MKFDKKAAVNEHKMATVKGIDKPLYHKFCLLIGQFIFLLFILSTNAIAKEVIKSNDNNISITNMPGLSVLFEELFKKSPNKDGVVVLQDKSEASFWFGYSFDINDAQYYVGFFSIHEFDYKLNSLKEGIMDQARIAQVTFRYEQNTWKVISKNAQLKSKFGVRSEPARRGEAPRIDNDRLTKKFLFNDYMLLAIPSYSNEQLGVGMDFFEIFSFNSTNETWNYLGGNVKSGQNDLANCEEGINASTNLPCMEYSGDLKFSSETVNGYPIIFVKHIGTDFCDNYSKVCPINRVVEYTYHAKKNMIGEYVATPK